MGYKKENIKGEQNAAWAHNMVGGKVRQTIKDIGGVMPEELPAEKHIRELKNDFKTLGKNKLSKLKKLKK